MSRIGPGATVWVAGVLGMLALPAQDLGLAATAGWAGCALAAGLALGLGAWLRREGLVDASFVLVVAAVALRSPDLGSPTHVLWLLVACGAMLVGTALVLQAVAQADPPLRAIGAQAAFTVGLAVAGAYVMLRLPSWSASAVSPRWADSVDAGSVTLSGLVGLVATAAVAGFTLLRIGWRRRDPPERTALGGPGSDPDPLAQSLDDGEPA